MFLAKHRLICDDSEILVDYCDELLVDIYDDFELLNAASNP